VLLAVARFFCHERKISKARSWFTRAVKLDPDFGDAWAYYYKFEIQFGTEVSCGRLPALIRADSLVRQVQQEQVVKHCVNAEPRHGELWQSVSKRPANWRMNTQAVLAAVLALIPNM
jgi:pre-mRNA-processing factor 6